MAFQPRINPTTGKDCCTRITEDGSKAYTAPACEPCRTHHRAAGRRAAALRSLDDYSAPDPYAPGIAAKRADDAKTDATRTFPAAPRLTTGPSDFTPPDPYAADLAKMRRENR